MFSQLYRITDHLYISAAGAVTEENICKFGIKLIINCTTEVPNAELPSVKTMKVGLDDNSSSQISQYFDVCSDQINEFKQRSECSLVHCVAGVSRSATVCIAYLMKYHGLSLRKSYYHLKNCRPIIRPNHGFFGQLVHYEEKLFGLNSVSMISSPIGIIPDVYEDEAKDMIW